MIVLIVDDERIIRRGIQKILLENIPNITEVLDFSSAQECLDYLETNSADLLITDIRMPGLSGLDLLRILHQKKLNIETIILSGYGEFEYCRAALKFDVRDYLLKPIDKDELIRTVMNLLGPPVKHQTVWEIKTYIQQNLDKKITVDELGRRFFLNANYVSQLFKKETGEQVSSYITRLRMEQACVYLRDCTKRVSDISQLVGYPNPRSFSVVFKRHFGLTPTEYRRSIGMDISD